MSERPQDTVDRVMTRVAQLDLVSVTVHPAGLMRLDVMPNEPERLRVVKRPDLAFDRWLPRRVGQRRGNHGYGHSLSQIPLLDSQSSVISSHRVSGGRISQFISIRTEPRRIAAHTLRSSSRSST